MEKINFKIHEYDANSNSLIISFASDINKSSDPDAYEAYAYQPHTMWPGVDDPNELLEKIALAGINVSALQSTKENFVLSQETQDKYSSFVGQTYNFEVNELLDKHTNITQ
jgi:hypothetical protein